jgi:hypothetical protein
MYLLLNAYFIFSSEVQAVSSSHQADKRGCIHYTFYEAVFPSHSISRKEGKIA